jgi:RHS repeat-associated protein
MKKFLPILSALVFCCTSAVFGQSCATHASILEIKHSSTNRNKFGYDEACLPGVPHKKYLTSTEVINYNCSNSYPLAMSLFSTSRGHYDKVQATFQYPDWTAPIVRSYSPGSAYNSSDGCSSTQDTTNGWTDVGCFYRTASGFFPYEKYMSNIVACSETSSVHQFVFSDFQQSFNMTKTITTEDEYTDKMLAEDIRSIMPLYPTNWGGSGCAELSFDSSHVDATGSRMRYRFRLPNTVKSTSYRVSWKEVTTYPNNTVRRKKMREVLEGTGDPSVDVLSAEHEIDVPNEESVTVVSSVKVRIISQPEPPGTGDGGSGFGGPGGGDSAGVGFGQGSEAGSPLGGVYGEPSKFPPLVNRGCQSCGTDDDWDEDEEENDGPSFQVSLGAAGTGRSAGQLMFSATTPSTNLYSPAALQGTAFRGDIEYITVSNMLRQVRSPQCLVDILQETTNRYSVCFWWLSDVSSIKNGDGVYPTNSTAQPYVTWTIENPNPPSLTQLRISEIRNGATVHQWIYSYVANLWTVQMLDSGFERDMLSTYTSETSWEVTSVWKPIGGGDVLVSRHVYEEYAWGEAPVLVSYGHGAGVRTTSYSYGSELIRGRIPLQSVVHEDGSWELYYYDSQGRVTNTYTSKLDAVISGPASARLTKSIYKPADAGIAANVDDGTLDQESPRMVIESWTGNEIARRYNVVRSAGEKIQAECTVAGANWYSPANLFTTNRYYTNGVNQFSLKSTVRPDKTLMTYDYNKSSDDFLTNITASGQADATYANVVDGVSNRVVLNPSGYVVSSVTYDVAKKMLLAKDVYSNDAFGRPQQVTHLDGTVESVTYGCCGPESSVDRDGVQTIYDYDPTEGRWTKIRQNITYTKLADAAGFVRQQLRTPASGPAVTLAQWEYDYAGRLINFTNSLGGRTHYDWSIDSTTGGKILTATFPDGGTRIEKYYLDGSLKELSGSAVQPVRYEYGIEPGNTGDPNDNARPYQLVTKLKKDGTNSDEWTRSYSDLLGRTYKVIYSDSTPEDLSDNPKERYFYNPFGQLTNSVDPDGVTTLYRYNSKGEQIIQALDVNRDNKVGNYDSGASDGDRVTQTTTICLTNGATGNTRGMDIRRTETLVWTTPSSATTAKVSTIEASTDGLHTWQISYRDQSNSATRRTDVAIPTSGNSWTRTVTQTEADGASTVTTSQNGRVAVVSRKANDGAEVGRTSYGYDGAGRQYQVTDLRSGTSTQTYNDADLVTSIITPSPAGGHPGLTTMTDYDTSLRAWRTTLPDGTSVTNKYDVTGLLTNTCGSRTYPVAYSYDYAGRMRTMQTWTNFNLGNGAAITTWSNNAYRGWLESKRYADASGPDYTYTPGGRLKTRTWARIGTSSARVQTTYTYGFDDGTANNEHGDLVGIAYSNDPQNTQPLTYTYDRRGRQWTAAQNGMTTTLAYNDANQLTSEAYTGAGTLLAGFTLSSGYDSYLRRNSLSLNTSPTLSVSYGYDNASRLQTVTMGSQSVTYSYVANSPLVEQIVFKNSTTPVMTNSTSYDYLNRLKTISSVPTAGPTTSFSYDLNSASQRVRTQLADGSYWLYEYDALGQVISGKKYWSDGTPVGGQQFGYGFDDIGNRTGTKVGGDAGGQNLRAASYTANNLNQYSSRSVTGAVYVTGIAFGTNSVTVGGQSASRKGEYFWSGLLIDNSGTAFWTNITTSSGGNNAAGNVFIPKTPEQFSYDADGNLTNDGRWSYTWDAENRLVRMEPSGTITAPGNSRRKLEFACDYKGRRIYRKVTNLDTSTVLSENKFLHDGWNLMAELTMANALVRSYGWGKDLSGTEQGAGGVGGLLKVTYYGAQTTNAFAAFDGNGNVSALVDAANGNLVAQYEYGPFGEPLRATGPMAKVNPFRFSTQYQDDETDLVCYLHRYFSPSTGRWLSPDPIEERGGLNLYGFVSNDPINKIDLFGLACTEALGKNGRPLMVFTDPGGSWSAGTVTFGKPAGGGAIQMYTSAKVRYAANVTVLCTCPCGLRNGVRVYTQEADGSWPFYNPGTIGVGVEIPTVTGVLIGLGKLGAKWINKVVGAGTMLQYEIDNASQAIAALPHPTVPSDGAWQGGKSPCSK